VNKHAPKLNKVILFYGFSPIADPEALMLWQKDLCESLNLKGRILISPHGINGTLGGEMAEALARFSTAHPIITISAVHMRAVRASPMSTHSGGSHRFVAMNDTHTKQPTPAASRVSRGTKSDAARMSASTRSPITLCE